MPFPELSEDLFGTDLCGVEDDTYHFRVAGAPATHLFLGWVGSETAGIAHRSHDDPGELPELPFCPPKTAHSEDDFCASLGKRGKQRLARDRVGELQVGQWFSAPGEGVFTGNK